MKHFYACSSRIQSTLLGLALVVGSLFFPHTASAQSADPMAVTVTVTEEDGKTPIIGAVVSVVNHPSLSGATDVSGVAKLTKVPGNATLRISFFGMVPQEVPVSGRAAIAVTMASEAVGLEQVVVVGYGTQKRENLTGAVTQVNMEKLLGDRPLTTVGAALQGAVPGLVVTGGAVPGAGMTFNIRGTTSINGGAPLILVDNVPADANLINPEDIESVTVLKDASAAIYGARAAFGVVLITTKKARKNSRLQLNYNNNFAFELAINRPQQATIKEILQAHLEFDNDGKYFSQDQDLSQWLGYLDQYEAGTLMANNPGAYLKDGRFVPAGDTKYYYLQDNDPTGQVLDKYGFMQTHNVSASGGGEKISYRISLGYTSQDGPLITNKDSYERINVASYISADITKWFNTALDIRYARDSRTYVEADGNVYNTYFRRFYPVGMMPKSSDLEGPEYIIGTPANHLLYREPVRYRNENPRIYSRSSIRPVKGLEGIFEYTFDQNIGDKKSYSNKFEIINDQMGTINSSDTPTYRSEKSTTRYNALNAYLTYNISTRNEHHNFKIMAGYSQEQRYWENLWASRKEMINPSMPSITGGAGETLAGDAFTDFTIRSAYFRFNYNYKEKYLVEVLGRYDGSSRFPTVNRFGFFPSVSAAWQLGKEKFMDWSDSWLNEFKIRANWGQIGNQAIGNYLFMPDMESQLANWIVDGKRPTTLGMPALVRQNFTWELVETLDIGVDLSLFSNRLSATFDWYQRDTKGMLAPGMELPSVVGANAPVQNTADLRTTGWELAINWRDRVGDWGYNVGFNIYDATSKITKYNNENNLLFGTDGAKLRYEGETWGEIWGYQTDGYYTIDDFQDTWKNGTWKLKDGITSVRGNNNIRPGDVKFVNLRDDENSTNEISEGKNTLDDPGDRMVIGNNTPRYQFGVTAGVDWKGFALSVMFIGTGQRDAWLSGDLMFPLSYGTFGTLYYNQLDYWKPTDAKNGDWTAQNPDAKYPRLYNEANASGSNYRTQTKYLSDASYIRLKNITLSYTVPQSAMKKIGLNGAKIFFSGENLVTFSKLPKGYDPERLNWGYPFYATYSFGISLTL